jgi:hypothetical protein
VQRGAPAAPSASNAKPDRTRAQNKNRELVAQCTIFWRAAERVPFGALVVMDAPRAAASPAAPCGHTLW